MKSKSFMLMILSMGFGLIAAIGISQVMGRSKSNAAPVVTMGTVLVAADHLDMKTYLTEENVKIENWPANIIPEDAITSIEEIADTAILRRLSKGMPLVKSAVIPIKQLTILDIPDGHKVLSVNVSSEDLGGGLLQAGDKVDVIGFFKRRNGSKTETAARTFLKALRVYSINAQTSIRENREQGGPSKNATVSLIVTEKQSEQIVFVQRTGSIQLVLRGDYVASDDDVQSLSDILDWGDKEKKQVAEAAPPQGGFDFSSSEQETTMIIWEGNNPVKVSFKKGNIPQNSGANPVPPQLPEMNNNADESSSEEFNGSDEIDRGLGQDQFQGV